MSAAPRFVQVPAPAGERWNWAEATPEAASAEFEVTDTVPRVFAAAAGAVTDPVGFVLSMVTVRVDVVVFPDASVTVTVWAPGASTRGPHDYPRRTVPPEGVETVRPRGSPRRADTREGTPTPGRSRCGHRRHQPERGRRVRLEEPVDPSGMTLSPPAAQ